MTVLQRPFDDWRTWATEDKEKLLREAQRRIAAIELESPGDLARRIFPGTVQTPALDILDQALIDAENGKQPWLIFSMPPQEGKSERVSRFFPIWCLIRDPRRRVAIASYADDIAMRWGRQTRDDITANPDLGLAVHPGISAAKEWQLDGHRGGIVTTGVGGALTGRPVDVLIVDDPFKDREEAESPTMRERVKNFWRSKASTRLPERSIVVIIMTRWHEDDLAGWLKAEMPGDFRLINIPAQAEHVDGNRDCKCAGDKTCLGYEVLGRQPGEYMISARDRTPEGWEQKKRNAGSYDWNALYQGHPSPADGRIFNRKWWRIHERPRAVQLSNGSWFVPGAEQVMISIDAAFKDTKASDYVAMTVWARKGARLDLVDIDYDRMEFTETCARLVLLCAKWPQASLRLIEDKANGPAIISQLRLKVGGLVPYTPEDSKEARARACAPFVEAGDIGVPDPLHDPDLGPKVAQFIEQCAGFPFAAHDDLVDSFTQAAIRLLGIGTSLLMDELVKELGLIGHELPSRLDGQEEDPDLRYVDPSIRIDERAAEWLHRRREVEPMRHWTPQEPDATDADPDDEPWR